MTLSRAAALRERVALVSKRRAELEPSSDLWADETEEGTRRREATDATFITTMLAEFGPDWSRDAYLKPALVEVTMFDPESEKFVDLPLPTAAEED